MSTNHNGECRPNFCSNKQMAKLRDNMQITAESSRYSAAIGDKSAAGLCHQIPVRYTYGQRTVFKRYPAVNATDAVICNTAVTSSTTVGKSALFNDASMSTSRNVDTKVLAMPDKNNHQVIKVLAPEDINKEISGSTEGDEKVLAFTPLIIVPSDQKRSDKSQHEPTRQSRLQRKLRDKTLTSEERPTPQQSRPSDATTEGKLASHQSSSKERDNVNGLQSVSEHPTPKKTEKEIQQPPELSVSAKK